MYLCSNPSSLIWIFSAFVGSGSSRDGNHKASIHATNLTALVVSDYPPSAHTNVWTRHYRLVLVVGGMVVYDGNYRSSRINLKSLKMIWRFLPDIFFIFRETPKGDSELEIFWDGWVHFFDNFKWNVMSNCYSCQLTERQNWKKKKVFIN